MAEEAKTFKSTGDPATDEVLKSMAEDGVALPEFGKPDAPEEDPNPSAPADEELDEEEDEDEPEGDEPEEEDESDPADLDEDEEDEDVETPEPPTRSVSATKKAEYWKNKVKILEKKLKERPNAAATSIDDELKKFAEEQKLPMETANKLVEIISKKALPPELRDALEVVVKERREKSLWDNERKEFSTDFNKNILPLLKRDNPNATLADVKAVQDRLAAVAWETPNAKKSLVALYFETAPQTKRKTGESTTHRGTVRGNNTHNPSDEDIENIIADGSDEEFEQLSESLGSRAPKLNR